MLTMIIVLIVSNPTTLSAAVGPFITRIIAITTERKSKPKTTKKNVSFDHIKQLLTELNALAPQEGYVYKNYGGRYFTYENAAKIDSIREKIEQFHLAKQCTNQEKFVLLTSLIFAIDKAANTVGQYDAYLKHLGKDSYDESGKHLIDSNVYKPIKLLLPRLEYGGVHEVYCENVNRLVQRIDADVLYVDPPYNTRQYIDNYHVLENIMRWDKPVLYGKTRKFERHGLKSDFSRKTKALPALQDLVLKTHTSHIFLSYNNEGVISQDQIIRILRERGQVKIFEKQYSIFGNGAGRSKKRPIVEKLYYCRVD